MSVLISGAGQLGDKPVGSTFGFKFNTHQADGTPIALAGTPAIHCYKIGSDVEDNSGLTLVVDYDSVVGLNNVVVDLSADGVFYVAGDFQIVITTGTVDSVTAIGAIVAQFSIGKGVDVTRIGGDSQSADDLKDFADTGYDPATHQVAAVASAEDLGTDAQAKVNAQVLDVVNVDTFAQPGQGAPPATTSIRLMVAYCYKWLRNKHDIDKDTGLEQFYNDDSSTVDHKRVVSDDGSIATKAKIGSGP